MPEIVGRKFCLVPEFMRPKYESMAESVRPVTGTCVWVHPQNRYAVLAFGFSEPVRECFTLQELKV